jgi:hypothetical protein
VTIDGADLNAATLPTFVSSGISYPSDSCEVVLDRLGEHEIAVRWVAEISVLMGEALAWRQLPSTPVTTREYSQVVRTLVADEGALDAEIAARFTDCLEFKALEEWLPGEWVPALAVVRALPLPVELDVTLKLHDRQETFGHWSLRDGFVGPLTIVSTLRGAVPGKVDALVKLKTAVPLSDGASVERLYAFEKIPVTHLPAPRSPK